MNLKNSWGDKMKKILVLILSTGIMSILIFFGVNKLVLYYPEENTTEVKISQRISPGKEDAFIEKTFSIQENKKYVIKIATKSFNKEKYIIYLEDAEGNTVLKEEGSDMYTFVKTNLQSGQYTLILDGTNVKEGVVNVSGKALK